MINIELTPIHFIFWLPTVHILNVLLLAWMPHFLLHQQILGIPFYRIHLYSHHKPHHFSSLHRYSFAVLEHSLWIGLIGGAFTLYRFLLPQWLAWLSIIEGLLGVLSIYYLHLEFDNPKSWLRRYEWFNQARKLHQIHHYSSREENFSNSKNYSFGGLGIRGHFADRLLGTFQSLETTSTESKRQG